MRSIGLPTCSVWLKVRLLRRNSVPHLAVVVEEEADGDAIRQRRLLSKILAKDHFRKHSVLVQVLLRARPHRELGTIALA